MWRQPLVTMESAEVADGQYRQTGWFNCGVVVVEGNNWAA